MKSFSLKSLFCGSVFASSLWAQATGTSAQVPTSSPTVVTPYKVFVPVLTDSLLQAKLDSLSSVVDASQTSEWDSTEVRDSSAAWKKSVQSGKYIERAKYDKTNFDHWKVDSLLQLKEKKVVSGNWRTDILEHGHAFRDASLQFANNDTLTSVTYTYADSARYMKTGEYAYKARYRFESDSTFRSREVFAQRNVVRWDYVRFHVKGDLLDHHLYKLEFRDLMDNWLDAIQEFDRVPAEVYHRVSPTAQSGKKI